MSSLADQQKKLQMMQKANEVLKIMEGFHNKTIDKTMIKKVLKIQNLVRELGA